ncbi:phytoene dehydrogenase-like protein [Rhizomicrobium palustre]|uniref:Pyridine nucleotide-disulfide oxidoreductase domain-containing protein 2 n=1 Tax=Rhizomicrobium palustre TaxID=189966 RepID=A0A846N0T6_9PROT|nr:NAD(P)/FAD-dependent oxidoreductase [Rhizomicrobium palustre]NIK88852.1 phytoene dehydrogenase-like protein [Rhizomicrobium palustre]
MADVLVIGASVPGLIAATYLARAGYGVTVLESDLHLGGDCANRVPVGDLAVPPGPHLFLALDPKILKELRLGLEYLYRDLPLIALRGEGPALTLPRDVHEARRNLTPLSERDAERFSVYRREHHAFARAMRGLWWEEGAISEETRSRLRQMQVTAATTWLDGAFETDALRASYSFDALSGGISPSAAGSALLFSWRAAQEMCGLQSAVAMLAGGPQMLVDHCVDVATKAGVRFRTLAPVARLLTDGERVHGVQLESGEMLAAEAVLSSLTRRKTLLDFLPPGSCGFALARQLARPQAVGQAKVLLGLNALPPIFEQPGRYVLAERLETASLAYAEARSGQIPSDLALEIVAMPTGTSPPYILSVLVRPVPMEPPGGWKDNATRLVQAVLRILEHHVPKFVSAVGGLAFVPPKARDPFDVRAMTSPWRARITTPLKGLYLCGEAAEPVPCLSGRSARIAASIVQEDLRGGAR